MADSQGGQLQEGAGGQGACRLPAERVSLSRPLLPLALQSLLAARGVSAAPQLRRALRYQPGACVVSVMHARNEQAYRTGYRVAFPAGIPPLRFAWSGEGVDGNGGGVPEPAARQPARRSA